MAYDRFPGIDENSLFPPEVREALAKGTTLSLNQDLNTVTDSGVHRAEFGSVAISIKNRPIDFVQPFMVSVRWISESNGILIQEAWMKIAGKYRSRQLYRVKLGENWGEWIDQDFHRPQKDSPNTLAVIGTSESEGSDAWVEKMRPLTSAEITNFARSGDDSNVVAIRCGAMSVSGLVANNTIPASGSVVFSSKENLQLRNNRIIATGTIAGIQGTLTHTANNSFTFTRGTSGAAKSVTGTQEFTSSFTTDASTVVVIAGGNDFNQGVKASDGTTKTQVLGNYYRIVEHFEALGKTVFVCGTTTRASTPPGSTGFDEIMEINKSLYSRYPNHYIDRQGYLSQKAIYDANLTPTTADLTAISLGDIPPQLRLADGVHETPLAQNTVATRLMLPWLSAAGAITPNSTPASLPELSPNFYQWDAKISTVEGLQTVLNTKASTQDLNNILKREVYNGDLNDLSNPGYYRVSGSSYVSLSNNYPVDGPNAITDVEPWGTGGNVIQTVKYPRDHGVWMRGYYGGTWQPWRNVGPDRAGERLASLEFDTGVRVITPSGPHLTGDGTITFRRVNDEVTCKFERVGVASTVSDFTYISDVIIPQGFRPAYADRPVGIMSNPNANPSYAIGVARGHTFRFQTGIPTGMFPGTDGQSLIGEMKWTAIDARPSPPYPGTPG